MAPAPLHEQRSLRSSSAHGWDAVTGWPASRGDPGDLSGALGAAPDHSGASSGAADGHLSSRSSIQHLFPQLMPDELALSGVGRLLSVADLRAETFFRQVGLPRVMWNPINTTNLALLCDRVFGEVVTIGQVLDHHSLLPYHSFTCARARLEEIRNVLLRGHASGNAAYGYIHGRRAPKFLRCCAECVARDEATLGVGAWYRLHQLPGTERCHEHGAVLLRSRVRAGTFARPFATAATAGCEPVDRILPEETARFVAREYAWLLSQPGRVGEADDLPFRIKGLLREHGYLRADGRTDRPRLISAFGSRLGERVQKRLGFDVVRQAAFCWSDLPWRPPALTYLLLLEFLGETAERLRHAPPLRALEVTDKASPSRRPASTATAGGGGLDAAREWLRRTLQAKPGISRQELRSLSNGRYILLSRLDPTLLPISRTGGKEMDWAARDEQWAGEVERTVRQILEASGRPVRVSLTLLRRGLPALCRNPSGRLPLTEEAIARRLESTEDYGRRLLEYLAGRVGAAQAPLSWQAFSGAVRALRKRYPSLRAEAERSVAEAARRRG